MKSLGLSRYNINSEGEADHISLEYYVANDADKEFAALRALLSDTMKALEPFTEEAKSWPGFATDDSRPTYHERANIKAKFTVGNLRTAAALYARIKEVIELT